MTAYRMSQKHGCFYCSVSLQKNLGTGGTVYEDSLEIQGDLRLRIAAFLEKRKLKFGGDLNHCDIHIYGLRMGRGEEWGLGDVQAGENLINRD